jgi:GntR family transcriptional repressor for pyruvate dehydrogenase complex
MTTASRRPQNPARTARARGLHVPKASELIARSMRRDIHRRQLKPGDALPTEAQLRERFEVSRPTLREALRILEAQQLVKIARGASGGARYRLPGIGMVAEHTGIYLEAHQTTQRDLTEARLNIEPCVVGFIAERADPAGLAALRSSVAAHRAAIDDLHQFALEHERFYELLAELCPNHTLGLFLLILREVMGVQAELLHDQVLATGEPARAALTAHVRAKEKLIALIEAQDRDGAEALWRRHLTAQLNQLVASGRGDLIVSTD